MMKKHSRIRRAGVLGATALVLVACGSDDGSADADARETSASTVSSVTSVSDTSSVETSVDGTASVDRSGETIKVGFVNEDNGPITFPEFRIGGEVAIDLINATGGINGATLEVVSCSTDLTPEASIDCANQMVESDVVLAFTAIDLASDAALPIYHEAGIPYITTNNWGSAQSNAEGSYLLHSAFQAYPVAVFTLMNELGITKVTNVYEQSPASEDLANNVVPPIAKQMGIEVEPVAVNGSAPDWTAVVATAQASGSQTIWGQLSEPGCNGLVTAARAADFEGEIVAGACNKFISELGADAVDVYTLLNTLQPSVKSTAPPEIAAHLEEYESLMAAAGASQYAEGYATWPYSGWMELREVLESIEGEIDAVSIAAQLDRDVTIPGWLGPDINCGASPWADSRSNCSAMVAVYQVVEKDGSTGRVPVIEYFDAAATLEAQ